MMPQCEMVLQYMKDFGSITPLDAMREFGCMRLASRISDLKTNGHRIGRRMHTGTNRYGSPVRYAEYYIEEEQNEQC